MSDSVRMFRPPSVGVLLPFVVMVVFLRFVGGCIRCVRDVIHAANRADARLVATASRTMHRADVGGRILRTLFGSFRSGGFGGRLVCFSAGDDQKQEDCG